MEYGSAGPGAVNPAQDLYKRARALAEHAKGPAVVDTWTAAGRLLIQDEHRKEPAISCVTCPALRRRDRGGM